MDATSLGQQLASVDSEDGGQVERAGESLPSTRWVRLQGSRNGSAYEGFKKNFSIRRLTVSDVNTMLVTYCWGETLTSE